MPPNPNGELEYKLRLLKHLLSTSKNHRSDASSFWWHIKLSFPDQSIYHNRVIDYCQKESELWENELASPHKPRRLNHEKGSEYDSLMNKWVVTWDDLQTQVRPGGGAASRCSEEDARKAFRKSQTHALNAIGGGAAARDAAAKQQAQRNMANDSKPAASPSTTQRLHGAETKDLTGVVQSAMNRALEKGKPDLAEAVNDIYQQTLHDSELRVILHATLDGFATPEQQAVFRERIRRTKAKLKERRQREQKPASPQVQLSKVLPLDAPGKPDPRSQKSGSVADSSQTPQQRRAVGPQSDRPDSLSSATAQNRSTAKRPREPETSEDDNDDDDETDTSLSSEDEDEHDNKRRKRVSSDDAGYRPHKKSSELASKPNSKPATKAASTTSPRKIREANRASVGPTKLSKVSQAPQSSIRKPIPTSDLISDGSTGLAKRDTVMGVDETGKMASRVVDANRPLHGDIASAKKVLPPQLSARIELASRESSPLSTHSDAEIEANREAYDTEVRRQSAGASRQTIDDGIESIEDGHNAVKDSTEPPLLKDQGPMGIENVERQIPEAEEVPHTETTRDVTQQKREDEKSEVEANKPQKTVDVPTEEQLAVLPTSTGLRTPTDSILSSIPDSLKESADAEQQTNAGADMITTPEEMSGIETAEQQTVSVESDLSEYDHAYDVITKAVAETLAPTLKQLHDRIERSEERHQILEEKIETLIKLQTQINNNQSSAVHSSAPIQTATVSNMSGSAQTSSVNEELVKISDMLKASKADNPSEQDIASVLAIVHKAAEATIHASDATRTVGELTRMATLLAMRSSNTEEKTAAGTDGNGQRQQ